MQLKPLKERGSDDLLFSFVVKFVTTSAMINFLLHPFAWEMKTDGLFSLLWCSFTFPEKMTPVRKVEGASKVTCTSGLSSRTKVSASVELSTGLCPSLTWKLMQYFLRVVLSSSIIEGQSCAQIIHLPSKLRGPKGKVISSKKAVQKKWKSHRRQNNFRARQ